MPKIVAFLIFALTGTGLAVHATESGRLRLRVPTDRLRLSLMRFTQGPIGTLNYGKIENGRYYPLEAYSMSNLGATNCARLLDGAQAFPLKGMLMAKYIDQETYSALASSEQYLDAAQVSFINVFSLLSKTEFEAQRDKILESQVMFGPRPGFKNRDDIPVTLATLYLVSSRTLDAAGVKYSPLPWTKDPVFEKAAKRLVDPAAGRLEFEIGRAFQVGAGYIDYALDAAFMTLAHEMAVYRAPFDQARVFMHSYKRANTAAYLKRYPALKVVATDENNPENVILMAPLAGFYSQEFPWNFSGVIQDLIAVDPPTMSVTKAWNILMTAKGTTRLDLDYRDGSGRLTPSPIVWRQASEIYSEGIRKAVQEAGLAQPEHLEKIFQILSAKAAILDPRGVGQEYADPISGDSKYNLEMIEPHALAISNLNPEESRRDETYELRVLLGSGLLFHTLLSAVVPAVTLKHLPHPSFAVSTTDLSVAKKLGSLKPSRAVDNFWQRDWRVGVAQGASVLNFHQLTVHTFYFTFDDLERLRHAHPNLFESLREQPAINQGFFFKRSFLERPLGL